VVVPGFVVAEIDLDEIDACLNESEGHQEGPAETVAAVAFLNRIVGMGDVEAVTDFGGSEEGDGGLAMRVVALGGCGLFERCSLVVDGVEKTDAGTDPFGSQTGGERETGSLIDAGVGIFGGLLGFIGEGVFGVGTAPEGVAVGRSLDEEGIAVGTHQSTVGTGNDAARPVDESFGENDGRGEIVIAARDGIAHDGSDGGPVVRSRDTVTAETGRGDASAGEHVIVAGGVVVRGVSEGTTDGPEVTALRESGEMFGDLQAGGVGRDRLKLTANAIRSFGLEIEGFVLRETSREEDIDAGLGGRVGEGCVAGRLGGSGLAKCGKVIGAETEETDRSRLNRRAASDAGVYRMLHGESCGW